MDSPRPPARAAADGSDDATVLVTGSPTQPPRGGTGAIDGPGPGGDRTASAAAAPVTAGGDVGTSFFDISDAAGAGDTALLALGTRLAEFEITRVVGQGGFGVVYEAWDHALERVIALKEYMPASLAFRNASGSVTPTSERQRETFDLGMRSFINEGRLLAQFDHPSLLKVYRFWEERGTAYLAMPFYRGETMKEALVRLQGQVPEPWLLQLMDGVTQALAVLHRANCFHRDIAPDNILLLEGSGLPVVLDFGAARRVITDKTQAMTVILKPGYAPIEQYAEMPGMTQGAWTDVYALAAVLHVAVTGRAPPASITRTLQDAYQPMAENPLLLQHFSGTLLTTIDRGLALRPADRLQSMEEFRTQLGLGPVHTGFQPSAYAMQPTITKPTIAQPAPSQPTSSQGLLAEPMIATRTIVQPAGAAASNASTSGSRLPWMAAAVAVLVLAGALGWWWSRPAPPMVASTPAAAVAAPATTASAAQAAPIVQPVPAVPAAQGAAVVPAAATTVAAAPVTPLRSLENIVASAASSIEATPRKNQVRIGKDRLEFEVRSPQAGYLYVMALSTGGEMMLLFPNQLDKRNKIEAGATLVLPRAAWPMEAAGPAGDNIFVAMVSAQERDFRGAGLQPQGPFGQVSLPVLAGLEAARTGGPAPLAGTPICEKVSPCNGDYGAAMFTIRER